MKALILVENSCFLYEHWFVVFKAWNAGGGWNMEMCGVEFLLCDDVIFGRYMLFGHLESDCVLWCL